MHDTTGVEGGFFPFTTTLTFDWPRPPLNLNDRTHWRPRAALTKTVRQAAADAAARLPDLGKIRVRMVWVVTDRRVRDTDNPTPTLKALCDGLVTAGVVLDDRPEYMTKTLPEIEWRDKKLGHAPHVELHIERIPA